MKLQAIKNKDGTIRTYFVTLPKKLVEKSLAWKQHEVLDCDMIPTKQELLIRKKS